jgi:Tfp pilus assembly protein PilV
LEHLIAYLLIAVIVVGAAAGVVLARRNSRENVIRRRRLAEREVWKKRAEARAETPGDQRTRTSR